MTAVFSVMRDSGDLKNREAWKKMLAARGKRDLYVIREGETLNFVQGTILGGSDKGDEINFEKEDGSKTALRQSRDGRLCLRARTAERCSADVVQGNRCLWQFARGAGGRGDIHRASR